MKRKMFLLSLMAVFGLMAINAQKTVVSKQTTQDEIFLKVDEMPSFPSNGNGINIYLASNMRYPKDAEKQGIEGRVVVTFVVEKDGSITNVEIIRNAHPSLDKEAKRIIEGMPNWNPGKIDGKPVRTKFTLPITFKLR